MTVKSIALAAAAILQADDIESAIQEYSTSDGDELDADAKTMVKCVNLAVAECNADFPVLHTARVTASGGVIPIGATGDEISTVRAVIKNGRHVRFSFDTRGILVEQDGEYTVTYTTVPHDQNLDDEVVCGTGADEPTLCYLAARNYCLVTGRNDEAAVWDQRYNAEAEKLRLLRRAYLPKRAWR